MKTVAYLPSEDDIVQTIYQGLTHLGYVVHRTGQRRADLAGNDEALPDMIVSKPGRNRSVMMEIKVPGKKPRPKQKYLIDLGISTLVTCWEEALALVKKELG